MLCRASGAVALLFGPSGREELTITQAIVEKAYLAAGGARTDGSGRRLGLAGQSGWKRAAVSTIGVAMAPSRSTSTSTVSPGTRYRGGLRA